VSRRRRSALAPTLAILGVLVVLAVLMSTVWTDVLWYSQIGFLSVYRTELLTRAGLFLAGGLVMGVAVASSLVVAYRSRPVYAPVATEQMSLDRYRETLEPLRKLVAIAVPAGLALFAGSAAGQQWKTVQLWRNSVPFGTKDAQFGIDTGFFVFTLPWLQFLSGFLTAVVFLAGLAAAVTHYLYGGVRLQGPGQRMTSAARLHLAGLAAVFLLLRGVDYWLSRYDLTTKDSRLITGLTYTDARAVLTAKGVLSAIAVIVAILFIVAALMERWRTLPLYGVALLVVSAILLNGIYPSVVQRFQVKPSEPSLEAKYITRNIQATRDAYGLSDVEVTRDYGGGGQATSGQLRAQAKAIPGIRLIDPEIIGDTFKAQQSLKAYYTFVDTMDVDRYVIGGTERDAVLAVRELNLAGLGNQRTWVIDHVEYTHGFGVVAAYGNERAPDSSPEYFQKDLPSKGALDPYEPRIYFGENSPEYSIVGAPTGKAPREFDYPSDNQDNQAKYTYTGNGGVSLGSAFNRLLYALKFREQNILLSDAVNEKSRILYDRSPRERVEKVAPYLTLDGDAYPSVVDRGDGKGKRIVWIIDGYTTSNRYPYSRLTNLQEVTSDSLTTASTNVVALESQKINYIRNSVKAVVDAYDGSVALYAWDDADPVLRAWQKTFPSTIRPLKDMAGDLMAHMRYPEDLFKVQRTLLARYHVTQSDAYYQNQDAWAVPTDPTEQTSQHFQPPYYLSLQMPGTDKPRYSLTSVYVPQGAAQGGNRVLSGYLAADSDAGNQTGVKRPGYGKLRLLALRKTTSVPGPSQIQNQFSDPKVTGELNILRNNGSQVDYGNLLALPLGGGVLYVQPVYVKANLKTSYPLLQKVLAGYGGKVGFANTLEDALDQVFSAGAGSGPPGGAAGGEASPSTPGGGTSPPAPATGGTGPSADLAAALRDAQAAVAESDRALKAGDFAAYGQAQKRLQDAIQRAAAAESRLRAPAASAVPAGSAGSKTATSSTTAVLTTVAGPSPTPSASGSAALAVPASGTPSSAVAPASPTS
jgi:uncharacterized membrane protein (UPF0182 family)